LKLSDALIVTTSHMPVAQPGLQERDAVPKPGYDDLLVALILSKDFVGFFRRVYGSAIVPSSVIHEDIPSVGVRAEAEFAVPLGSIFLYSLFYEEVNDYFRYRKKKAWKTGHQSHIDSSVAYAWATG
jgi:hypothetical protein